MPKPEYRYDRRQSRKGKTRRENLRKKRRQQESRIDVVIEKTSSVPVSSETSYKAGLAQFRGMLDRHGERSFPMSRVIEVDDFSLPVGSVELDSGEYFEWERHPSSVRIAWSADADLPHAIGGFRKRFGAERPDREGMITNSSDTTYVRSAPEIARIALTSPGDVFFYRVDYEDSAVGWNPPTPGSQAARYAEAMLITSSETLLESLTLIQSTATQRVAALAKSAIQLVLDENRSDRSR